MSNDSTNEPDDLPPWGGVISGQSCVSARRIANALNVPVSVIKSLVKPTGKMKFSGRYPFDVYDPALVEQLQNHPEVVKALERRQRRKNAPESARKAAQTRRERCVDKLCERRPELRELYEKLVARLWSPASEKKLLDSRLYAEFPAMLWDAFAPRPGAEDQAIQVIVDILWAMLNERTWRVNEEEGGQDIPQSLLIWQHRVLPNSEEAVLRYENVFAAAIRHLWFDDRSSPRWKRRELALTRLGELSSRRWPSVQGATDSETEMGQSQT